MKFSDLVFPITIVAPDGWTSYASSPQEKEKWCLGAIDYYNKAGFMVFDSSEAAYKLVSITPRNKVTMSDRIRSIFTVHPISTYIIVEPVEGDALLIFRESFSRALSLDDDSLSQFNSKEKVIKVVNETAPLSRLMTRLAKMHVTA